MLSGATEIIDALRDQLRFTRDHRPASDVAHLHVLGDLAIQLHALISRAQRELETRS